MWALIVDGVVRETTDSAPSGRFHEDLQWEPCAADVEPGWLFSSGVFSEPAGKSPEQLKREELQSLAKVFNENKNSLNAAWLAAAVADGTNETTRKDAVIADIAELQTEYDADCAAVRAKYA